MSDLDELFARLPEGWSLVTYAGHRWSVTRTVHAAGRSESVYAEALDGSDVVSANLYRLDDGPALRPCEMSAEKVLDFLRGSAPSVGAREQGGDGGNPGRRGA